MTNYLLSFFKKPSSKQSYYDWGVEVDMHNHILPALDDGAPDLVSSHALLAGLYELGFKQSIFTPHIASTLYENNPELISFAFESLKDSDPPIQDEVLKWPHRFAAEYMLDDVIFQRMEEGLLCFPSEAKYVLVEFSYIGMPYNWHEMIFEIIRRGYQPILAHPERYSFLNANLILEKMVPAGLNLQLNLLSLSGYYGMEFKKTAELLMAEGGYQFAGTDLHHLKQLEALKNMKLDEKISNRISSYSFYNERLIRE